MKKIMLMIIIVLLSIIVYQGGCFDGCTFVRVMTENPMDPIIRALEGIEP